MREAAFSTGRIELTLEQRLLGLFRQSDDGVLSGERIGAVLSISRTAVWKHVKRLRDKGYRIDAVPARGYRLVAAPDALTVDELAPGLSTLRIGCRIVSVPETGSTNQLAFQLADEGAVDGTAVIAETQTGGRGRLGRRWESPPAVNLYCSVIIRPPIPPMHASQLTFLSAVAVSRAIEKSTGLGPRIKWPNDILVNGRKVAGLLNEMNAETDTIHCVVLGIGVNINMERSQFPEGLRQPATSLLLESGKAVDRREFTRDLLSELDILYDGYLRNGFAGIRDEWLARSMLMGKRVRVSFGEGETSGEVAGIDSDGALLLKRGNGSMERVLAGDVTML